jgi:hypothetical protein
MTKKFYIILCVLGILVAMGLVFWRTFHVWWEDVRFAYKFRLNKLWEPYLNQHALSPLSTLGIAPRVSLCFVTMETRGEKDDYVRLHNTNLEKYVAHRNQLQTGSQYAYKFVTACAPKRFQHQHNVYWCKFFYLREILEEGTYDYVAWLDSDTAIGDFSVDFARVLARYQGHWFAGLDKPDKYDLLNAGVVIVRNSKWGRKILRAITETYNDDRFQRKCVKNKNRKDENTTLSGAWAQTCYEQGVMNRLLYDRFRDYVTILPPEYIHNGMVCDGDFITHLYNSSAIARANCFRALIPSPRETSS